MDEREHGESEDRLRLAAFYVPERVVPGRREVHRSPSGAYELEVNAYRRHEPDDFGALTRGVVRRISDGRVVADLKRDRTWFWHAWVSHPNGREYLLCSERAGSYCVIDLGGGTCRCCSSCDTGVFAWFNWRDVSPSPDGRTLAVFGSPGAASGEYVMYDFSDPERLPLPEIEWLGARFLGVSDAWDDTNFVEGCGWTADGAFVYRRLVYVRASDGTEVHLSDLPFEEAQALRGAPGALLETIRTHRWMRP